LITGASRGIGSALSLLLAQRGDRVVLAARDEPALVKLAQAISARGGQAEVLPLDLSDDASVEAAVARLLAGGPVDVLVNNAGVCEQGEFLLRPAAHCRAELELNYCGPLRITRALLPSLIRRGTGTIVNVSSLIGSIASPTTANYGASKAALEAWSFALRAELARFGLRVTVFVAPHTDTEMGRRVKFAGVHSLPVDYTARELMHALDRAPRRYAGSPVYRVLLRLAQLFPVWMERRVGSTARSELRLASASQLSAESSR
jgi:3-oxoacyl-[acyl-carrier protein] reductase